MMTCFQKIKECCQHRTADTMPALMAFGKQKAFLGHLDRGLFVSQAHNWKSKNIKTAYNRVRDGI